MIFEKTKKDKEVFMKKILLTAILASIVSLLTKALVHKRAHS